MEIFGIGLPEVLLIAVVALIFLGPERLPDAARTVGKAVYDFRKAIEPARTAWADVQRDITNTIESAGNPNAAPKAPERDNPWKVHPLAEGLSPEERERFFSTGELPQWRLDELAALDVARKHGLRNGTVSEDVPTLDYPDPAALAYEPAPPFAEPEELFYPEPGNPKSS